MALVKTMSGGASTDTRITTRVAELDGLFAALAARAQREGSMRSDIPPREVVGLLNIIVCRPGARVDDRLTTVVLDGLAVRPGHTPCGGPAVTRPGAGQVPVSDTRIPREFSAT